MATSLEEKKTESKPAELLKINLVSHLVNAEGLVYIYIYIYISHTHVIDLLKLLIYT